MTEVAEVKLPGVGVRHEFEADSGQHIGVLVHHDGRREILVYDRDDPDACTSMVELTHDDTRTLAELLGATQVSEEVAEAEHHADGPSISWITIKPECVVDGTSIATGEYRSKTGASVIAVLRDDEHVPNPPPDFVLRGDDVVVAVGTHEAVDHLRELLEGKQ